MIEATGAQIVVTLLKRQGIKTVAGIPGGSVLPLYDELMKSDIDHILVRHEQGGGFFAQGMARSTGETAVCIATSGPGAMNLLTAVADARSDSIPMVAITGQVNTYLIGTDAFQEADTFGLSFPITKHSIMVNSAEELLRAIPDAFRIAASGRPGPVLVDIPRDIQLQKVRFDSWPEPGKGERSGSRFHTSPENFGKILAEAARILVSSSRPVLYAGGGCASPAASKGVRSLLEAMPMPVATSLMGIGVISTSDPQAMGMVGMHGSIAANRAMHDSDVVLACGVRFDDRATGVIKRFCPDARIIHIDIDAAEINKILPAVLSLVADAESSLPVLARFVHDELSSPAPYAARAAERADWLSRLAALHEEADRVPESDGADSACSFIAGIPAAAERAGLDPSSIIVTTDVGQHQMWTAQHYPFDRTRQFLTSGSLGTMGFGLPTALGAAAANPDKRVVCVSGDGSIMMNIQELATLAERNYAVTVIVLDNGALGMVRQQQELLFDKRYSASVFSRSPDLLKIAEGFGIAIADADDPDWAERAFASSGPVFVVKKIRQAENVYPFVPAGKANVEAMTAPAAVLS